MGVSGWVRINNNAKSVQFSFTRASAELVNYAVVLELCLPKDDAVTVIGAQHKQFIVYITV